MSIQRLKSAMARRKSFLRSNDAHAVAVEAAAGLDLGRLAEVGIGAPRLAFFCMQDSERNQAQRVVGIELDRPGRVGDRAVDIALVAAGNAAVEVGRRDVRIDVEVVILLLP